MIMGGMPYLESSFDMNHHHNHVNKQTAQCIKKYVICKVLSTTKLFTTTSTRINQNNHFLM